MFFFHNLHLSEYSQQQNMTYDCNLNLVLVRVSSKILINKLFFDFFWFQKRSSRPNPNLNICCCWILTNLFIMSLKDFIYFFNIYFRASLLTASWKERIENSFKNLHPIRYSSLTLNSLGQVSKILKREVVPHFKKTHEWPQRSINICKHVNDRNYQLIFANTWMTTMIN